MTCVQSNNVIVCFSKIDFSCPYCESGYEDSDEIYLKRCNKNKYGYTKKKCKCGEWFGITFDMTGKIVSFKLREDL